MVSAELAVDLDDATWDKALLALADHNVFQGSAWARHKADAGWTARRALRLGPTGAPVAAAQLLIKRAPGGAVLWGRGGPMGDVAFWDEPLRRALATGLRAPVRYLRVCSYQDADEARRRRLAENGWKRPKRPFNPPTTFHLDLSRDEAALEGALSSNWAHNQRRGLKRAAVRAWDDPDPEEMVAVYRAMEAYKGVKAPYDAAALRSLISRLGPALRLWRADDDSGKPVALRACALFGDGAWDLLAASSDVGRKVYASYALLWKLLLDCKARGARRYDLGGADERTAKGVFDFKKGTGAVFTEYLGEWDWASPAPARAAVGWLISRKAAAL